MKKIYLFILSIFCFGCKTYTIDQLPEKQVVFGKGGGITGAVDRFILLENGQLFKQNSLLKDTITLPKVKRRVARNYFTQVENLQLDSIQINQPGNRYYYLGYKDAAGHQKATWGANDFEPPVELKTLFDSLNQLTISKIDKIKQ